MSTIVTVSLGTEFGIFVGLFNKLNGTSISVNEALKCPAMVDSFKITSASLQSNTTTQVVKTQAKSASSTKKLSYEQFQSANGTSVAYKIYKHMKAVNKKMSRADIAAEMNIRLSTVCGQINLMLEAGLVEVTGTKVDLSSNREVEVLVWR